ncbi:MAG: tRNA epoxyqueuosine(34) reductase QueG [Hydrogenophilus sp.]|nr:tRNA epoxyqueuosine(34) reductase QueG [Hydrogenophilus sp.]
MNGAEVVANLRREARRLGFADLAVADISLPTEEGERLSAWLRAGFGGAMDFLSRWGERRLDGRTLSPKGARVIMVRFPYGNGDSREAQQVLSDRRLGYCSRYALGEDYHRVLRKRLIALSRFLKAMAPEHEGRVFVDSAPISEVGFAAAAGLGWRGKHTLLVTRSGSFFFLGGMVTNVPLPLSAPVPDHCGRCRRCLEACPTGAIVAPYRLDARRCISYLTIEHPGPIPEALRPLMGNRIYGCDDCQLVCPWNRFASGEVDSDFIPRPEWRAPSLVALFGYREEEFLQHSRGMALRRVGYERFLRNVAVALGNAPTSAEVVAALSQRKEDPSLLVRAHVRWALARHGVAV